LTPSGDGRASCYGKAWIYCRESESLKGELDMTKSDLVRQIGKLYPSLRHDDVERVVDTLFDAICSALARKDRVALRRFGTFWVKNRAARPARNPRTGTAVSLPHRSIPAFRMGKHLFARLNENSKAGPSGLEPLSEVTHD
jgi:integration host factor subunit beta